MSGRAIILRTLPWDHRSRATAALVAVIVTACGTGVAQPTQPPASQPQMSQPPASPLVPSVNATPTAAARSLAPASPLTAPGSATLTFTGTEYAFQGPDTVQAGKILLTFSNTGAYGHHAQLWRLKDGISIEAYKKILARERHNDTLGAIGSLAGGVGIVGPGSSAQAIVDLTPGTYFLVCWVILSGGNHLYRGMYLGLTVTKAGVDSGWVPAPEATVTFSGAAFQMPTDIAAGHHVWTFQNDGPGARSFEVRPAIGDGFYGGGGVIDEGGHEIVVVDLPPGDYLAMSSWVDTGLNTTTAFTVH